jgi:CubicO group peptidase (beta-lactamase class C family)
MAKAIISNIRALLPIFAVLLVVAAPTVGAERPLQSDLTSALNEYLTRVEAERGLDAAVLVARGDDIILRQGYGVADEASGSPFSPDTVIGIASISKQFAASAIMRLVDAGLVSLDQTLGSLLQDIPDDKAGITVHQLLTHTSGLRSDHMENDLEPLTRDEALDRILNTPLISNPGEQYSYSNSGYTLLAAIIEEVSGEDYHQFLADQFFLPLRMNNTGKWDEPRFVGRPVATGYMNGESSGPLNQLPGPYWTVTGNGDIVSTVDDMLTWYRALSAGEVLSPSATESMFTSYPTEDGSEIEYGYGWEISKRAGLGRIITHNGGGLTGNSILSDYQDLPLTIIILGNRISYRTLGPVPVVIRLPADETAAAIARVVATGDFSKLPTTTFMLWPYAFAALVLIALMCIGIIALVRNRRGRARSAAG